MIEAGLERPRIDLEENLSLANHRAFLVVLADDVTRHLGPNLGIHESIRAGHPLAVDGHILPDGTRNQHIGIRQIDRLVMVASSEGKDWHDKENARQGTRSVSEPG